MNPVVFFICCVVFVNGDYKSLLFKGTLHLDHDAPRIQERSSDELHPLSDDFIESINWMNSSWKAVVQHNAELAEFLLFLCEYVAKMEKNYMFNMPTKEKYMAEVEKRASSIFPSEIDEDIYFRRWLWMLLAGDENQCHSLGYLRTVLKKDTEQYLWFARQMKIYYSVLSDDIHSKSALEIRYMKCKKFPEYIKFFNGALREAIKSFIQSFDKI